MFNILSLTIFYFTFKPVVIIFASDWHALLINKNCRAAGKTRKKKLEYLWLILLTEEQKL